MRNATRKGWKIMRGDREREFFGVGCRVGIASLGGERGYVVGFTPHATRVELSAGETILVPDEEVWRQSDPMRPWGHDGWYPFCYLAMTWTTIDRAIAIAGVELQGR